MNWKLASLVVVALVVVASVAYFGIYRTSSGESGVVLKVFLGAAAEKPWKEIIAEFEKETGIKVEATFGGSGTLLSQIEISKEGDIYGPGSQDYIFKAMGEGLIVPNTTAIVAYLVPAIIVPAGNPKNITSLEDLARPGVKVGIADPETVCVGQYAVDLLKYNGLWEAVEPNIVVYAESCSKTAMLAATGSVDAIIGWHAFHYWYPNKTEIIWLKPEQIPKIAYIPIGVLKYSNHPDAAMKFIQFATESEFAKQVFRKYHYFSTEEEAREYAPYAEIPGP